LLHAEQGLGDAIQFSRYARMVQQRGAKVMLEVPQALVAWAGQLGGVDQAVIKGQDLPPHDLHCPLMSLPLAFRTSLSDIPGPSPHPGVDRLKSQAWRERLGHTTKPRVGLVWSGGKAHRYDHKRSMSLAQMLDPLPAGIEYVSLQQTVSEPELAQLLARGVSHHGHLLHDFADTAALCEQMDLVISVDTSVAHLAATMGQATWTLLPCSPDWRWLLNRSDSPWYPSMKLYRQDTSRDWSVPMAQVRQDLLARFQLTE
jgi:ADP-heptose:LPS heptosyltransferase